MDNLSDNEDVNRPWEYIKENIKTLSYSVLQYELKKQKPRFDKESSTFSNQRKLAEMQWLQDPNQINADNLNNADVKLVDISGKEEGISESKN